MIKGITIIAIITVATLGAAVIFTNSVASEETGAKDVQSTDNRAQQTVVTKNERKEDKPSWWTGVVRHVGPRDTSMQTSCINNLRQIEAAKEQWALEEGKATGDPVILSAVNPYIKGGTPVCPAGATYTYNNIGTDATCDHPDTGHGLP